MTAVATAPACPIDADLLERLRCPHTGLPLRAENASLVTDAGERYPVTPSGIPLFARHPDTHDARVQQRHYDRVARVYVRNLTYPHTEAYTTALDRVLLDAMGDEPLGDVAELCCGRGDAARLLLAHRAERVGTIVGVDVSGEMLERAAESAPVRAGFVQADARRLPLAEASIDTVVILGGIHHVNDRGALFAEVRRVLRPGGRLVFREPLNDFVAWRALRAIVYRLSPNLDARTERPLRAAETRRDLAAAGLVLERWRPCGGPGFLLFMNSDVLVVNRLLRFVPGIRAITRAAFGLDELLLRPRRLRGAALQVVGVARRPAVSRPARSTGDRRTRSSAP